MPQLEFTPWRNNEELLRVRRWFYPLKDSKDADRRRSACNRVYMWKLRGNLPHAIESTSYLTEAVIHDDPKINSPSAIRAVYSTAFCRFVTGLTDAEQSTKRKQSMYKIGKDVGIPTSFVELRHEATHGDLPSLVVLRRAAERSLLWLYNEYWSHLDDLREPFSEENPDTNGVDMLVLKKSLKDNLRTYIKKCLDIKTKGVEEAGKASLETATSTGREIVRLCQGDSKKLKVLVEILLERKMLVPSTKTLGSKMGDVFLLWDKLLRRLAFHQMKFLIILTDEMSLIIMQPSLLDITFDEYREAMAMWLRHILADKIWDVPRKRSLVVVDTVLRACITNPSYWMLHLATSIIDDSHHAKARTRYGEQILKAVKQSKIAYLGSNEQTIKILANLPVYADENRKP